MISIRVLVAVVVVCSFFEVSFADSEARTNEGVGDRAEPTPRAR